MTAGRFAILFLAATVLAAHADLSQADLDLLHSPNGWEYLGVFDRDNGVQMHHVCFVEGHPNPDVCSGTLTFSPDGTFAQVIRIHGTDVNRHGTYQIEDSQIAFYDELGTKDGPYQIELNAAAKTLRLMSDQAGVKVGADLRLVEH